MNLIVRLQYQLFARIMTPKVCFSVFVFYRFHKNWWNSRRTVWSPFKWATPCYSNVLLVELMTQGVKSHCYKSRFRLQTKNKNIFAICLFHMSDSKFYESIRFSIKSRSTEDSSGTCAQNVSAWHQWAKRPHDENDRGETMRTKYIFRFFLC